MIGTHPTVSRGSLQPYKLVGQKFAGRVRFIITTQNRGEPGLMTMEVAAAHGWRGILSSTASHGGVHIHSRRFKWAKIHVSSGPPPGAVYAISTWRIFAWRAFIPRTAVANHRTGLAGPPAKSLCSKESSAAIG